MKKSSVLVLVLIVGFGLAVDPHFSQENPGYTRAEYDAFQKAVKLADLGARATALNKFIDANPKSKLVPYAKDGIGATLQGIYKKKDMATLGRVAEQFLQLMPGHVDGIGFAFEAFNQTKNYGKAAKYGEAYYAKKASPMIAQMLASIYYQLKNDSKFIDFAQKAVVGKSPKEAFPFNSRLAEIYIKRKSFGRASRFCQRMLAAYSGSEVPPGFDAGKWREVKIRNFNIMGKNHYDGKRYPQAVRSFQNTLRLSSRNGMAFYYLGMSNWGAKDHVTAMKNLSKALSVQSRFAKVARSQLEALYKASNNGSLDGLERRIKAAASELK